MITLNLISPALQQELKFKKIYLTLKNALILILLFTIGMAIVLLITKMILQKNFYQIIDQTTLLSKSNLRFISEIRKLNSDLQNISKIQKEYIPWSKVLLDFVTLVPDKVMINELSFNQSENQLILKGKTKSRDLMLQFKDNLENSSLFSGVELPLSSLLKKEDVDFEFKAKLNLGEQ